MPQVIRLIGEMNRATLEEQPVSYSVLYRMIIYTHVSDDQSHTDVADAPRRALSFFAINHCCLHGASCTQ